MPIYEYQCSNCDTKIERLQKMSDAALTDCPECEQAELKRLISSSGFRLKGTGWYETDFKNKGKRETSSKVDNSKKVTSTNDSSVSKGKEASS